VIVVLVCVNHIFSRGMASTRTLLSLTLDTFQLI